MKRGSKSKRKKVAVLLQNNYPRNVTVTSTIGVALTSLTKLSLYNQCRKRLGQTPSSTKVLVSCSRETRWPNSIYLAPGRLAGRTAFSRAPLSRLGHGRDPSDKLSNDTKRTPIKLLQPLNISIHFLRWNDITLVPDTDYAQPDMLIIGGWHHGKERSQQNIETFLDNVNDARGEGLTIVVGDLPAHFPGGKWDPNGPRGPAIVPLDSKAIANHKTPACNYVTNSSEINSFLPETVRSRDMALLRLEELYMHRGDAHVGKPIPDNGSRPKKDCLHWCIAPGVLDGIALQTLALMNRETTGGLIANQAQD